MAGFESEQDLEEGSRSCDDTDRNSICFSNAEDPNFWHSLSNTVDFNSGANYDEECKNGNPIGVLEKGIIMVHPLTNFGSECSELNSERGEDAARIDVKLGISKSERDCRICHLDLDCGNQSSGVPIELGCSCRDDLAVAHKHCAEAWFKIKGDKICEICGSTADNVVGVLDHSEFMEHWSEKSAVLPPTTSTPPETSSFQQGHRVVNFLLGCMVFALVVSWIFHFNVPS